ncbi:ribosome-inactivating family protein [Kitasatospora sp. NPDC089509]|uniref:ribosome-inactivating family protein n=1 Tax=Kitasatospora sp. NPDC089509 TaxID=3364079 RepID=UPI00381859F8
MAAVGVSQGLSAQPAQALPTGLWTLVDWDISNLTSDTCSWSASLAYNDMISTVRNVSGQPIGNGMSDSVTTTEHGRYIEVRLMDHGANRLSILLRADNLYMDGFINAYGRFVFRGTNTAPLATALLSRYPNTPTPITFPELPWNENYNSFSSDSWRRNTPFTALRSQVNTLIDMQSSPRSGNAQGNNVAQALTQLVAATSEAARFPWIQRRIANTIGNGGDYDTNGLQTTLGPFGAELENNWSTLSVLLRLNAAGRTGAPVTVDGRIYRNHTDIELGNSNVAAPAIGPMLTLGSVPLP